MIEAMKQALEALEYPLNTSHQGFNVDMAELLAHKAITSLRQAIAEAEKQEPVAWMYDWTTSEGEFIKDWTTSEAETLRDTEPTIISNVRPLYTHPQPKVEQEPVIGTKTWFEDGKVVTQHLHPSDIYKDPQPKREWVGLTDEEIDTWNIVGHESLREFVREIEAKLKKKNI